MGTLAVRDVAWGLLVLERQLGLVERLLTEAERFPARQKSQLWQEQLREGLTPLEPVAGAFLAMSGAPPTLALVVTGAKALARRVQALGQLLSGWVRRPRPAQLEAARRELQGVLEQLAVVLRHLRS